MATVRITRNGLRVPALERSCCPFSRSLNLPRNDKFGVSFFWPTRARVPGALCLAFVIIWLPAKIIPIFLSMITSRLFLAAFLLAAPVFAQTKAAPKAAPKPPGNLTFSGDLSYRASGLRLTANAQGLARVRQLPELDASARAIALDWSGSTISQVRALGSVNFKLNLAPKGGGAPARIEATCDSAVLTPRERRLVLTGRVKGFYQLAGGARNTLSGDAATLRYEGENLVADLTGGATGIVTLRVPAETLNRPDALGDVTITAQHAQINQGDGSASFIGQARAVSSGGPNGFDVSAPRFTLTRGAGGTIDTLKTVGRTLVKLDLPPEPVVAGTPAAPNDAIGKPTHVEVAANSATIDRATSTATFEGNVKGFYRLIQGGVAQNFDFSGTKAVIRSASFTQGAGAGFNLEVSGAEVEGPAFNLGF